MAGAGEAWQGAMLHKPAQGMIQVPISSSGKCKGQTDEPGNSQFYPGSDFRRVLDFEAAPDLPVTSGL